MKILFLVPKYKTFNYIYILIILMTIQFRRILLYLTVSYIKN